MDRRLELIAEMSPAIWIHLVAVAIAVFLGAAVLLGRKGTKTHKLLGRIWAGLMVIGAVSTFWIMEIFDRSYSPIHILSVYTLISVVAGVRAIRAGRIAAHRRHMISLYATGLVIAGGFTFLPNRLLGRLTFGETYPVVNYVFIALVVTLGIYLYYLSFRSQPEDAVQGRNAAE
ncbi:MAG: DUF2306 domain-containing protein [Pseudomonadota bacterium]